MEGRLPAGSTREIQGMWHSPSTDPASELALDDSAVADLDGLDDGGGERFTSAPSPGNSRSSMITLVCNRGENVTSALRSY